jgi:hypothetical protein
MAAAGGHWTKRKSGPNKGKARFVTKKKGKQSASGATTKRNVRVESENGSHYLTVNGERWARFNKLEDAHAAAQGL